MRFQKLSENRNNLSKYSKYRCPYYKYEYIGNSENVKCEATHATFVFSELQGFNDFIKKMPFCMEELSFSRCPDFKEKRQKEK